MPYCEHTLKIGILKKKRNEDALTFYDGSRPLLLVNHDPESIDFCGELAESLLIQMLAQHPHGAANVYLYEAIPGLGFSNLKRVYAKCPGMFGQPLIGVKECRKKLDELEQEAHRRYSQFAAADVKTIHEYNKAAPHHETSLYLVITSIIPFADDPQALQHLRVLCRKGPDAGIIPLFLRDLVEEPNVEMSDSVRNRMTTFWDEQQELFFGFFQIRQHIEPIAQDPTLWRLLIRFGMEIQVDKNFVRKTADELIQRVENEVEQNPHTDFLDIPIGYAGYERASFRLGELSDCYHAMIGGANRSGKTTLVNNIILSACETNSPDDLRLWLFDFKDGVSFSIYDQIPHVEVLHINNDDKPYVLNAFDTFTSLMAERSRLFRQCSPPVSNIAQYNRVSTNRLPRLVMFIDEAQSLFDDRDTKTAAKKMIREISRKGASFGLHLILITQSYQNVDLDNDAKSQFRLRVALKLATSMECRALMGRDNDAPMHLPRFQSIYNEHNGDPLSNRQVKLDLLENDDLFKRIEKVVQKYPVRETMRQWETAPEKTDPIPDENSQIPDWLK